VLHLLDVAVVPLRPGVFRVCGHEPDGAPGAGMTGLRVLLVADLLTRTAELFGLQAFTAVVSADRAGSAANREIDEELGFHRPDVYASCEQARLGLGGRVDVHVTGPDAGSDPGRDGLTIRVGHADGIGADGDDAAAAVRLALMSFPYHQPVALTMPVLASAAWTLRGWRRRVAEWAESPSRPIPPHIIAAIRGTFSRLDTASALALLHDMANEADPGLLPGARFEAFVYADRVLGPGPGLSGRPDAALTATSAGWPAGYPEDSRWRWDPPGTAAQPPMVPARHRQEAKCRHPDRPTRC
jgi:hypothetical protein